MCFSFGYISYDLQWSRHPLHWANHMSINENLANVDILSVYDLLSTTVKSPLSPTQACHRSSRGLPRSQFRGSCGSQSRAWWVGVLQRWAVLDSWKGPWQGLLKVLHLRFTSHSWSRCHLPPGPAQMLGTSESKWQGRRVADAKGAFPPKPRDQGFLV